MARKVVILAREAGLALEMADVPVQSLVPVELQACDVGTFIRRLPEFDAAIAARLAAASAAGQVLRYVGIVDPVGTSRVELAEYPATHPFASLSGSDNMMSFTTKRYNAQPLVVRGREGGSCDCVSCRFSQVRGPGAGAEVTAGGVFGDLLVLANRFR